MGQGIFRTAAFVGNSAMKSIYRKWPMKEQYYTGDKVMGSQWSDLTQQLLFMKNLMLILIKHVYSIVQWNSFFFGIS